MPLRVLLMRVLLILCLPLIALGCSAKATAEKVWHLDVQQPLPGEDATDAGWSFGKEVGSDTSVLDDTAASDAAADALVDAGSDVAPNSDLAAAADTAVPPNTSCGGVCGQFVEGSGCHCNAACSTAGNCCADYVAACNCKASADCDDANDCTTDTCDKGFCKQIPFIGCCASDADCGGGTLCKPAVCEGGACTLKAVDCDDALPCTTDSCDLKDGSCVHKVAADKCAIDGACIAKGTVSVDAACAVCDPAKSMTAWTISTGKCLIDGACVATASSAAGSGGCQICDPIKTAKAWSLKAGTCNDGDACTAADVCDGSGSCVGKPKANCCISADDCLGLVPGDCEMAACVSSACILQPNPDCCLAGVCCDTASQTFQPAGTVCDTTTAIDVEYQCGAGGDTVEKRNQYYGCTGTSAVKCSSSTPAWGPWKTSLTCSAGAICTPGPAGTAPTCTAQ